MTTRALEGKRKRSATARTRVPDEPPGHLTPDQAPPSPLDALQAELVTLDALAYYVVSNLEDGASEDPDVRRRYGRLVGLLADHAAGACESVVTLAVPVKGN